MPGATASDLEVWLAVVEEWGISSVRLDWTTGSTNLIADAKDDSRSLRVQWDAGLIKLWACDSGWYRSKCCTKDDSVVSRLDSLFRE